VVGELLMDEVDDEQGVDDPDAVGEVLSARVDVGEPPDAAASGVAERADRVEPVDGQLAQALMVRALRAETLEHEGGVGDRQLVPVVDHVYVAVGCVVALRKLAGHLVW
jgi:hypothetical protein